MSAAALRYHASFLLTTASLLEPLGEKMAAVGKADAAAAKRLARAEMVHVAIASKLPAVRLEDLKRMTIEWIHGMLEATFPLESSLTDADCADASTLSNLLLALDGAHALTLELTKLHRGAGRLKETPSAASDDRGPKPSSSIVEAGASSDAPAGCPTTPEEVSELLHSAVAAGAPLAELVPASASEAQVLGQELWEALCWRRGALRYYIAKTRIDGRHGAGDNISATPPPPPKEATPRAGPGVPAAATLTAGARAVPCIELLEAGHAALRLLLQARREAGESFDDPPSRSANATLEYGIYSTTHLLALAFDAELCYWRWATLLRHAELGAPSAVHVLPEDGQPPDISEAAEPPAAATSAGGKGDATDVSGSEVATWFRRAVVRVHRYLHTVDVLMEGCGWDTKRSRELLALLEIDKSALATALQGEVGVAERELAALKISGDRPDPSDGRGSAGTPRKKGGGKKGVKGAKGR